MKNENNIVFFNLHLTILFIFFYILDAIITTVGLSLGFIDLNPLYQGINPILNNWLVHIFILLSFTLFILKQPKILISKIYFVFILIVFIFYFIVFNLNVQTILLGI